MAKYKGRRCSDCRVKLERILGKRIRCEAFVDSVNFSGETVLLKWVKFMDGRIICDHLWVKINREKRLKDIRDYVGYNICFSAEVNMYFKKGFRAPQYGLRNFDDITYYKVEDYQSFSETV